MVELNINEGDEDDDAIVVALMQGGDLAAMHAAFAIASPVDRVSKGCCALCNLTKPWWTNVEACEKAWQRTFAYQCVANHVNVFKLRGFAEKFPGHAPPVCPHCAKTLTDAFVEKERLGWEGADDAQRLILTREHTRNHLGGIRGQVPILPMEQRCRAESALHARTNATANNISVTFMAVPFSERMRKEANALLKRWKIFWRFPEKKVKGGGRIRPVQGNDSRAFHTIPELLVQLFDIFYPEAAAKQVDEQLTGLGRAAAGATDVRESATQQAATAGRKRPTKRKGPQLVGVGGSTSTTADVTAYRARRSATSSSAAAPAAATSAAAPPPGPEQGYDAEEEDSDSEDDEDDAMHDRLPENAVVGGVRTAITVWLTSIRYQEAAHAKLADPDSEADLRAYAKNGQAAGRAWATAVQMHCSQTAPWQYVHRAFAHFEEDVMENGHRDTVDDSLLEKGNRSVKQHSGNVMQGVTNEPTCVEQTHHNQYEDGSWYSKKSKPRKLPKSVTAQVHIRVHAGQTLAEDRPRPADVSKARGKAKAVKKEDTQRKRTKTTGAFEEYEERKLGSTSDGPGPS